MECSNGVYPLFHFSIHLSQLTVNSILIQLPVQLSINEDSNIPYYWSVAWEYLILDIAKYYDTHFGMFSGGSEWFYSYLSGQLNWHLIVVLQENIIVWVSTPITNSPLINIFSGWQCLQFQWLDHSLHRQKTTVVHICVDFGFVNRSDLLNKVLK